MVHPRGRTARGDHRRPRHPREAERRARRDHRRALARHSVPASRSTRSDGLLQQGAPGWAFTWMDARVDGQPVTQRGGKAVEIQRALDQRVGHDHRSGSRGSAATRAAGSRSTTSPAGRSSGASLAVTTRSMSLGTTGPDDGAIRPNQLLAMSLPHGAVQLDRSRPSDHQVAEGGRAPVPTELAHVTFGMRSLSPNDPALHRAAPRWPGGARPRVPRGNESGRWLDRAVRRRCAATGERPRRSTDSCPPGRVGPAARSPRPRDGDAPHGATDARSRRGRWPSCCGLSRTRSARLR